MPSRYSITLDSESLKKRFNIESVGDYQPRFNAAPSQLLPVLLGDSNVELLFFNWGIIPDWSKNKTISDKLIQANWNSMKEKPAFQRNLSQHRCIVPADGFYLWKNVGKKRQIPYRILLNSGEAFGIPAIWEEYESDQGAMIRTFKIITVDSNKLVKGIHPHMPAMLKPEGEKEWLNLNTGIEALGELIQVRSSDDMTMYSVSPKINAIDIDDDSLIAPAPAADQFGNYSLFD